MNKNKKYTYDILSSNVLNLYNTGLINELLNSGILDKFLADLQPKNYADHFTQKLYGKKEINHVEIFLINLDYFITYVKKKIFIFTKSIRIIIELALKTDYSKILLGVYYKKTNDIHFEYIKSFDKMMIERFCINLKILYPYIKDIIDKYNVNILEFDINNRNNVDVMVDLLRMVVISNYYELDFLLYQLYDDISYLKNQKSEDSHYVFAHHKLKWELAFENMDKKYNACKIVFDINNLKKKRYDEK